jgi:hypothetical protein
MQQPADLHAQTLAVCQLFDREGMPYALGGALAYSYYGVPRSTSDLDVNVFLPDSESARVLGCLAGIGIQASPAQEHEARTTGQVRLWWAGGN